MIMPTSVLIAKFYHPESSIAESRYGPANGVRINVAHQLADILFLSPQRAAGFNLLGLEHGLQQLVLEPEVPKFRFPEGDQFLAEFLQSDVLAFPRAFAGL